MASNMGTAATQASGDRSKGVHARNHRQPLAVTSPKPMVRFDAFMVAGKRASIPASRARPSISFGYALWRIPRAVTTRFGSTLRRRGGTRVARMRLAGILSQASLVAAVRHLGYSGRTYARTIRACRRRGGRTALLAGETLLRGDRGERPRQVLLPVDVPLSERPSAHGPCAQLHHWRRALAIHAHERQERPAADGLGC